MAGVGIGSGCGRSSNEKGTASSIGVWNVWVLSLLSLSSSSLWGGGGGGGLLGGVDTGDKGVVGGDFGGGGGESSSVLASNDAEYNEDGVVTVDRSGRGFLGRNAPLGVTIFTLRRVPASFGTGPGTYRPPFPFKPEESPVRKGDAPIPDFAPKRAGPLPDPNRFIRPEPGEFDPPLPLLPPNSPPSSLLELA